MAGHDCCFGGFAAKLTALGLHEPDQPVLLVSGLYVTKDRRRNVASPR